MRRPVSTNHAHVSLFAAAGSDSASSRRRATRSATDEPVTVSGVAVAVAGTVVPPPVWVLLESTPADGPARVEKTSKGRHGGGRWRDVFRPGRLISPAR